MIWWKIQWNGLFLFDADRSCLSYMYLNINALSSITLCKKEKLTQHQMTFFINIYFILTNIMRYISSDDIKSVVWGFLKFLHKLPGLYLVRLSFQCHLSEQRSMRVQIFINVPWFWPASTDSFLNYPIPCRYQ